MTDFSKLDHVRLHRLLIEQLDVMHSNFVDSAAYQAAHKEVVAIRKERTDRFNKERSEWLARA